MEYVERKAYIDVEFEIDSYENSAELDKIDWAWRLATQAFMEVLNASGIEISYIDIEEK